jgi:hypothetical protein
MSLVGNVQLVQGGAEKMSVVFGLLEREGIKTKGNPDLFARVYAHFAIEDARNVRDRATRGALGGDRRVFVIAAPVIAADAQNTLLKTIEEPAGNALFIFIVPSPEILLPTVRSRSQMLELEDGAIIHSIDEKKFLSASGSQRLDMLKPLLEKDKDDRRDLGAIITFLSSLERIVATVKPLERMRTGLESIYRARKHVADKGALVKPLLEQVALLVPRV